MARKKPLGGICCAQTTLGFMATSLATIRTAVVQVCNGFGVTASEKRRGPCLFDCQVHTARGTRRQIVVRTTINSADTGMSTKVKGHSLVAWSALCRYGHQLYDLLTKVVPLALKLRLLRADFCKKH